MCLWYLKLHNRHTVLFTIVQFYLMSQSKYLKTFHWKFPDRAPTTSPFYFLLLIFNSIFNIWVRRTWCHALNTLKADWAPSAVDFFLSFVSCFNKKCHHYDNWHHFMTWIHLHFFFLILCTMTLTCYIIGIMIVI